MYTVHLNNNTFLFFILFPGPGKQVNEFPCITVFGLLCTNPHKVTKCPSYMYVVSKFTSDDKKMKKILAQSQKRNLRVRNCHAFNNFILQNEGIRISFP